MDISSVKKVITDIHAFIQQQMWLDFEVIEYSKNRLTIIGSIDISIDHDIEICFDDVFFVSLPMEWKTDTSGTI